MAIAITAPSSEQSCYEFRVGDGVASARAYLTYNLSDNTPRRNLLLLPVKAAPGIVAGLAPEHRAGVTALQVVVNEFTNRGRRAVDTAKAIVNQLDDGELMLPGVAIAVHRFGPVPVYVVPDEYLLEVHGEASSCRLALYPDIMVEASPMAVDSGTADPVVFLRSLRVRLRLDVMMQRYLEDTGEYLFDIEHHSGLVEAFRNAKEAERVLSESIEFKVEKILRPGSGPSKGAALREAEQVLQSQAETVVVAHYARCYGLYMIHTLYEHLGRAHRTGVYLAELTNAAKFFAGKLSGRSYDDIIEENPAVQELQRALGDFQTGGDRAFDRLAEIVPTTLWVRRFVEFTRFVFLLREQDVRPTQARLFFSSNLNVPSSATLRQLTERHLTQTFPDRVRLLYVAERRSGVRFHEQVRTRIWMTDTLKAVFPRSMESLGQAPAPDLSWIAREMEHALLLRKRVVSLVEQGTVENDVMTELGRNEQFLSPQARVRESRAARVQAAFRDRVRIPFAVPSVDMLDQNLVVPLNREAQLAIEDRAESLLVGIFAQFSSRIREQILRIQLIAKHAMNRDPLERALGARRGALAHIMRAVRQRSLVINGQPMFLVRRTENGSYQGGLVAMVKALRPELADENLTEAAHRIRTRAAALPKEGRDRSEMYRRRR